MNEIISEMDKEQSSFDSLSAQIDVIKDQASAEFKDISTELIKSQNRLALLMSRNMFCFNLVCMWSTEDGLCPSHVTLYSLVSF